MVKLIIILIFLFITFQTFSQDLTGVKIDASPGGNCANGTIDLTMNGGIEPFEFEWSSATWPSFSSNLEDISFLQPGEYTVIVTDYLCGMVSLTFIIDCCYDGPFGTENYRNNSYCSTQGQQICDGYIVIGDLYEDIEDYEPITYSWTGPNGFTSQERNIYNLCPGFYILEINVLPNCTYYISKYLCCCSFEQGVQDPCIVSSEPFQLGAQITDCTNQSTNDGYINLIYSGYSEEFSFRWSADHINQGEIFSYKEDINNLSPGLYSVTVSDGCNNSSEQFYVGRENCIDENGNNILSFNSIEIIPAFPGGNNYMSNSSVILDVNYIHSNGIYHYTSWFQLQDLLNPIIVNTDTYIGPPNTGIVTTVEAIGSGCEISKYFDLNSCNNYLELDIDYSNTAYCFSGSNGSIDIRVKNGVGPYRAIMYRFINSGIGLPQKIKVHELESQSAVFSLSGVEQTDVYYLYIADVLGNCSTVIQTIPCQCEAFYFHVYANDPCGDPDFWWFDTTKKRLKFNGVSLSPIYNHPLYNYYRNHINLDILEFEIIWPDGSKSIGNGNGVISGPGWYDLPGSGIYNVLINDPFGCTYIKTISQGSENKCIQYAGDNFTNVLEEFYNNGNIYDFDNNFVLTGCYKCDYCGPNLLYCDPNLHDCGLNLPDNSPAFRVIPGSILDSSDPCNGLSFVCPLNTSDVITINPGEELFSQFIDWENPIGQDALGNCLYPCGCLYPPGGFNDNYMPIWLETVIRIPGCEIPEEQSPCEECPSPYINPIYEITDDCITEIVCYDPPCVQIRYGWWTFCKVQINENQCDLYQYCAHNLNLVEYVQGNIDCDDVSLPNNSRYCNEVGVIIQFANEDILFRSVQTDTVKEKEFIFDAFPNPTNSTINFTVNHEIEGSYCIEIYDNRMSLCSRIVSNANNSKILEKLSMKNLSSGVYYCKFISHEFFSVIKVLKI